MSQRISAIDLFCHVVDNFGDIGFVYRFARELRVARPHLSVRIFVDDLAAFREICPEVDPAKLVQVVGGIECIPWAALTDGFIENLDLGDVLVEAFACRIPANVLRAAASRPRTIINLEHLSAEAWVEGYHLKPSLLGEPNLRKFFYMPGITEATGGVVVDSRLERVRSRIADRAEPVLRRTLGPLWLDAGLLPETLTGTVFTYTRGFDTLINDLHRLEKPALLLVFGAKSHEGMRHTLARIKARLVRESLFECGNVRVALLPFLRQRHYDALLGCVDFNIVRGEDSLVRAIMAGRPFIWNAYLQDGTYQRVKVEAFLDRFRNYFQDQSVFHAYRELCIAFNSAPEDHTRQITDERFAPFFGNLLKIGHATREISYFLARQCNLIRKFTEFLDSL